MKHTNKVKITERGFGAHFIGNRSCGFRRNTLIEKGEKRVVVSTVGNYQPKGSFNKNDKHEHEIGARRFYETMAFEAKKEGVYWEANIGVEVPFTSNWALSELEQESDLAADEMHEAVVREIATDL